MEELIGEYGRAVVTVLAGILVLAAVCFAWDSFGSFMVYFQDSLIGG